MEYVEHRDDVGVAECDIAHIPLGEPGIAIEDRQRVVATVGLGAHQLYAAEVHMPGWGGQVGQPGPPSAICSAADSQAASRPAATAQIEDAGRVVEHAAGEQCREDRVAAELASAPVTVETSRVEIRAVAF
ncbi:MAG: hypothetical protein IPN40_06300 [Uliginosibacterium sp.]|nr:hypothetical protein [Uliginosibacterium sp.]